jgi:hypothetical protein
MTKKRIETIDRLLSGFDYLVDNGFEFRKLQGASGKPMLVWVSPWTAVLSPICVLHHEFFSVDGVWQPWPDLAASSMGLSHKDAQKVIDALRGTRGHDAELRKRLRRSLLPKR